VRKAGAYPNEEPKRRVGSMALPTNIRLGWKGLPRTNTLAFHEHLLIMDVNGFITLGPRNNVIKTFRSVIYEWP
jgi:hypothetical protein